MSERDGVVSVDLGAIRGSRRSNSATYSRLLDPGPVTDFWVTSDATYEGRHPTGGGRFGTKYWRRTGPTLIVYFALQRYLIAGLTIGAEKG